MQLYRGMDVGTAKLTDAERRGVPHHLLDVWDVRVAANVADYQRLVRRQLLEIAARGRRAVLVGGSGLYVRAALDDLAFPGTDDAVRARLEAELADVGPAALHARLAAVDPAAAAAILPSNGRRVVRALEVVEITGAPFTASLPEPGAYAVPAVQVGLTVDRPTLDARIETRVDRMWEQGLVEEVRRLAADGLREGRTASTGARATRRSCGTSTGSAPRRRRAPRRCARPGGSPAGRSRGSAGTTRVRWLDAGVARPVRAGSRRGRRRSRRVCPFRRTPGRHVGVTSRRRLAAPVPCSPPAPSSRWPRRRRWSLPRPASPGRASPKEPTAAGSGGAVSSVDADATRVGLDVLEAGGNAADAAVATAAALGVTEPYSAGIGGGGFFVYYDAASGEVQTIDGRETAPQAMTATSFLDPNGAPIPFADAVTSGLSVGVPGTPATWDRVLDSWGTMSLSDVLAGPTGWRADGFVVDQTFHDQTAANVAAVRELHVDPAAVPPGRRPARPSGRSSPTATSP